MTNKYRYLGKRGIFIEKKQYNCNDIVESEKSLEELGLNPHQFADLKGRSERDGLKLRIEALENEKEQLRIQSEKELKSLKKAYDGRLESQENKITELKKIYSEEFEPKKPVAIEKPKEKKEKIKLGGGR